MRLSLWMLSGFSTFLELAKRYGCIGLVQSVRSLARTKQCYLWPFSWHSSHPRQRSQPSRLIFTVEKHTLAVPAQHGSLAITNNQWAPLELSPELPAKMGLVGEAHACLRIAIERYSLPHLLAWSHISLVGGAHYGPFQNLQFKSGPNKVCVLRLYYTVRTVGAVVSVQIAIG